MKFTRLASVVALSCFSATVISAAYDIQELPTQALASDTFGLSIDNSGLVLTAIEDIYNPPIDVSLLPLDNEAFTINLTDLEAVRAGQINEADYSFIVASLRASSALESQFTQAYAQFVAFSSDGTNQNYINAFDEVNPEFDSFTFSMDTIAQDSVAGQYIVGDTEGPFSALEYVNDDGETLTFLLPEFDQRGFVQVGDNVTGLVPQNTLVGGNSTASSINSNLQVAGSMSVGAIEVFETAVANCNDDDVRGDLPVESCLRGLLFTQSNGGTSRRAGLWINRAAIWDLDAEGTVVNETVYGLTFDLNEEQQADSSFASQAVDINNQGVAVGSSTVLFNETVAVTAATLFTDGVSTRILEDDDFLPNRAVGINDNNIVIVSTQERINGANREKMLVHNLDTNETRRITGFFESSATTPRAINQNNIVVGNAEVEAILTGTRRRAGFIYDYNADTFTNINNLVACDSEYTILEAVDINDNGEIVATALTQRPIRDFTGASILNDQGEETLVDTVVTLKLSPTGQAAPDCSEQVDGSAQLERQGASTNPLLLFGLLLVVAVRTIRKRS